MPAPVKSFNELKRNLKKDFTAFPVKKLAVLGDSATQFLVKALKGIGYEAELNLYIYEAEYNQIDHEIIDSSSELYTSNPEYVIIFQSTQKLLNNYFETTHAWKNKFADERLSEIRNFIATINQRMKCKIIFFNFGEINDNIFGNFSNKLDFSFSYQVRKINLGLMDMCRETKNLYINDVCALQNMYGIDFAFDPKLYVTSDLTLSLDFTSVVAKSAVDIIQSLSGKSKKCLILDLDNTLWGGIIGDDGIEGIQIGELGIGKAFTELQLWAKQLKERGIILAVSSKNDSEVAKNAFDNHPDMVLSYEDFAVFNANWDNKADNIKQIQQILNIGFDSMVFLDDNPFERNMVRNFLPEVTIPELPEDPAEYLTYLRSLNLFETSSYSEEDSERTELYRQEYQRTVVKQAFVNEDEYLTSLEMVSECKPFDNFTIPRVAQLTQRSNQFNLRTIRYTEDDVHKISSSDDYITFSFTLEDKFGHYGLISLIILKKQDKALFVDTWIMSCRVLKRTVENFVLNNIIEAAAANGYKKIIGEFIPTAKNKMVKDHYKDFGFRESDGLWELDVKAFEKRKSFINKK
jgi:FkbH-like protein